jgi:hypothetical protein
MDSKYLLIYSRVQRNLAFEQMIKIRYLSIFEISYCPETRYESQMIDQEHCVSGLQFKIKGTEWWYAVMKTQCNILYQ